MTDQSLLTSAATNTFVAMMSQGTSGDLMWMDYSAPRNEIGYDAYAREIDFPQINIDLIAGMVEETEEKWREAVAKAVSATKQISGAAREDLDVDEVRDVLADFVDELRG